MNPRAVRWLVVVVALACAASTEAAPRRAKRKPKTSPAIFGPAIVSGIAHGAPPVAADAERRDTITPYRNALDQTVYSTKATRFDVSRPLRELPAAKAPERDVELNENELPPFRDIVADVPDPVVHAAVPPLPAGVAAFAGPVMGFNFEGTPSTLYSPPDNNGSVGNNQYVEATNVRMQVWALNRATKTATSILGPIYSNTMWAGFGGPCEQQNSGDPIVIYDKIANRWLFSQITGTAVNGTFYECVALSTTADATGSYYRWAFASPNGWLFDYPHYGVWWNAYAVQAYGFDATTGPLVFAAGLFVAMDRTKMLAGDPGATWQVIVDPSEAGYMVADLDGFAPPPTGAPIVFASAHANSMSIYRMKVDFTTPANTVKTLQASVPIAPWTRACPLYVFCVPQPGSPIGLNTISERLMFRGAYRNFIDHESLVVAHTVDPSVSGVVAGVRWYDIRLSGEPDAVCPEYPCIHQQGTLADVPNGRSRFMPSVAMDAGENMLAGYSASGKVENVENQTIRYAGRAKGDPLGTMPVPESIAATGTFNSGQSSWGDYNSMSVDPFDDCTFWFVNQYITYGPYWNTRVVSATWPAGSGPGQCPALSCTDRPATAPAIGSAVAVGDNRIDLAWTGIDPAPGSYAIERAVGLCGAEGLYQPLAATSGSSGTFTDTTVQGGVTYSYRVLAAEDGGGRCQALVASGCVSATAAGTCHLKPSFTGAAAASSNDAATCGTQVSWFPATSSCPLAPVMRYSVYRGTTPDFVPDAANRIATCITGSAYVDTDNLVNGASYHYVVRAEDGSTGNGGLCGGNAESNTVRVTAAPHGVGMQAAPGTWTDDGGDATAQLVLDSGAGPGFAPTWRFVKTPLDPGANHTPGGTYAYRNAGPGPSNNYTRATCASLMTPTFFSGGTTINVNYWERHSLEYRWDGVTLEYSSNEGEWTTMPQPRNAIRFGCVSSDAVTDWEALSCTQPLTNGCGSPSTTPAFTGPYGGGSACADVVQNQPITSYAHRCHQISGLNLGDSIRIRWRFTSNRRILHAGFYLDDIAISNVQLPNACSTAYSCAAQAVPSEVSGLTVTGASSTTLTWTVEPAAASYDVVSSTLSDLRAHGASSGSCLTSELAVTSATDARPDPAAGDGYYYLVRARDVCGRGTYGADSSGTPREIVAACP